jgi:hypothetical protein
MIQSDVLRAACDNEVLAPYVSEFIERRGGGCDSFVFTPTEVLAGIAAIMEQMRDGQDLPVRQALHKTGSLTPEEEVFIDFANSAYAPYTSDGDELLLAQTRRHSNPGVCPDAEKRFGAVLRAQKTGLDDIRTGPVIVYRDLENAPILIQKYLGADSALGLEPIMVDGVRCPAGTLYSVYSAVSKKLHQRYLGESWRNMADIWLPRLSIKNVSTADIESIAPLRLSTLGLPPATRPYHPRPQGMSTPLPAYASEVFDLMETVNIHDFSAAFN